MRYSFDKSLSGKLALKKIILSFTYRRLTGLGAKLVFNTPKEEYYVLSFDKYRKTYKVIGQERHLGDALNVDLDKAVKFLVEKEALILNAPASSLYFPLADLTNPSPSQKSNYLVDYLGEIAVKHFDSYNDFIWYLQHLVDVSHEGGTEPVILLMTYEDLKYEFYYSLDTKTFVFLKYTKGSEEFTLKDLPFDNIYPADVQAIIEDSSFTETDKLRTLVNYTVVYNYREDYGLQSNLSSPKED